VFGFLGPNGSGKTTTLRVLLDIIRPNRGHASIFGYDCQTNGVELRQQVGYLPGELSLPPTMRARDYLSMVNSLYAKPADPRYLNDLCDRLDLDTSRRIREYSRGNKQKLGLVAAIMHKPKLLMLDEPTGGLDPLVQQTVLALVREARADGRTVFFSSHILPEVQAVCDRIGVIREGRLVAVETISDLLARRFHRLRLKFADPIDPTALVQDGVTLVDDSAETPIYKIQRNLAQFMQQAAQHHIIDIATLDLSLEDAFLAFYGKEGANHA
jgi:ABC-2 type transport system ATP-binding protein